MNRIIIDTDIGSDVDDAIALALAMKSPEISLEGITTVYGDTLLRARLVKKLLHLGGRDEVKVYAGIEQPLLRNREIWWTGHEGELLRDDEEWHVEQTHGVDYIIETVMNNPGEITLVPIGPLTNIAAAIIREPRIARQVKEIIIMGGVVRLGEQAADLPYIEHNIKCDPEAASLLFSSGAPVVMVGLDVTLKVRISTSDRNKLFDSPLLLNSALARSIDTWLRFKERDWTAMHDPLTVSLLIDRSIVRTRRMNVHVEYDHRHPTGQTIAVPDENGNVEVCLDVDNERFLKLLMSRLV